MDKMREEFEKEYGELYLQKEEDGSYAGFRAKIAWEYWQKAWQASRAALVVELPQSLGYPYTGMLYLTDVEHKLDKVGIKYE